MGASTTTPLFGNLVGQLIETAIYNSLKYQFQEVSFLRYREKEIDFIIKREGIIPLEIKAGGVSRQYFKHLLYFAKEKHLKRVFMGSLKEFSREKIGTIEIIKLPLYFMV